MTTYDRDGFTRDLLEMVARMAEVPSATISLDDDLREDLGLDSMRSLELLSRLSELWQVDVDLEDVVEVRTVGQVVECMSRLAAARQI